MKKFIRSEILQVASNSSILKLEIFMINRKFAFIALMFIIK